MNNLPVAVALATFNGEKYLREQLDSLAWQSVKPTELVVCDDGSGDSTVAIVRDFATTAPFPVQLVENPKRLGYKANFMKAASLCRSPLIAFCDQDDVWLADKIEVVSRSFWPDTLAVSHDFCVLYADGRAPVASFYDDLARVGLPLSINIKGCCLAFRREFIDVFGWPNVYNIWSHDIWVSLIATMLARREYIRRPLIKYRIHGNNVEGWHSAQQSAAERWLRRLSIPPFTTQSDFDVFLSLCTHRQDYGAIIERLSRPIPGLTEARKAGILASLRRRMAIVEFLDSEAYCDPLRRTATALKLFAGCAYRDGDGLKGFQADLRGRRSTRHFANFLLHRERGLAGVERAETR